MAQNKTVLQQITTSTAEFSRKLLSEHLFETVLHVTDWLQVLQAHEGNLVASPLSAQLVLVLAQLGARGRTAEQMKVGLALPEDVETVKTGFHELMESLTIANRMYVKTGLGIEADFVAAAEKTFNSTVKSVEFEDPAVRMLNNLTHCVLVNTVYFKGQWAMEFKPKKTRPLPFYTDGTKSVMVPFMHQEQFLDYANVKSLDAEIVQVPYVTCETDQASLVIVLPKSRTGLAALEAKIHDQKLSDLLKNTSCRRIELFLPKFKIEFFINLNPQLQKPAQASLVIVLPKSRTGLAALEAKIHDQNLPDLLKNTSRRYIELFLPKFKIEFFINLNPQLQKMGMSDDVFGDTADFSGISPPVPFDPLSVLRVSHVMQKTFIEIDENGTEAASASYGRCTGCKTTPKSFKVCVDRPFLFFLISEKASECDEPVVLFAGRVTNIPPA
ncbi:hypothetical protein B566_EDAN015053 [Ephemera danica]|nr:hypothetical protein B566_EDAN015053 [Ephemera danica]